MTSDEKFLMGIFTLISIVILSVTACIVTDRICIHFERIKGVDSNNLILEEEVK